MIDGCLPKNFSRSTLTFIIPGNPRTASVHLDTTSIVSKHSPPNSASRLYSIELLRYPLALLSQCFRQLYVCRILRFHLVTTHHPSDTLQKKRLLDHHRRCFLATRSLHYSWVQPALSREPMVVPRLERSAHGMFIDSTRLRRSG
jgi:hypothetical protein